MKYLSLISVVVSLCAFNAAASIGKGTAHGKSAVLLASSLNELGLLSQATWGKSQAGDSAQLLKQVFDASKCGDTTFKALDVRVQSGPIRCRDNKSAIWDNTCFVQARDNKAQTVTGEKAKVLLDIIRETSARASVKSDGDAKVYSVPSVDCTLSGWQICKGIATCNFP